MNSRSDIARLFVHDGAGTGAWTFRRPPEGKATAKDGYDEVWYISPGGKHAGTLYVPPYDSGHPNELMRIYQEAGHGKSHCWYVWTPRGDGAGNSTSYSLPDAAFALQNLARAVWYERGWANPKKVTNKLEIE